MLATRTFSTCSRSGDFWQSSRWLWLWLWLVPLFFTTPPGDDDVQPEPVPAPTPLVETLDQGDRSRSARIQRCLAIYYLRPVDADELRPWSIMHGLIAYGQDTRVVSRGRVMDAVEYLCHNGIGNDRQLMNAPDGRLHLNTGNGVQGHEGQFLAMLAQSRVPRTQAIEVDGHSFTVEDLIEYEKRGCQAGTELTFRLIGLSHYLDSDDTWTNDQGETWNISRLMGEEIRQTIDDAACGGTHRLMGLSYGLVNRNLQGHELNDSWRAAERFLADYQKLALDLQNRDGSFSTEWFQGGGAERSAKLRLYTTGHILEWLAYSLPDKQLKDPRVGRAVDYLTGMMLAAPGYDLDVGPRGHALHALLIYHQRMYGPPRYQDRLQSAAKMTGGLRPATEATPQKDEEDERPLRGLFNRRRQ